MHLTLRLIPAKSSISLNIMVWWPLGIGGLRILYTEQLLYFIYLATTFNARVKRGDLGDGYRPVQVVGLLLREANDPGLAQVKGRDDLDFRCRCLLM